MTADIRSRLVARMHATLERRTESLPNSIPVAIDVGPLADAVIEEMSEGGGVPPLPRYDPQTWAQRRWTEPFVQEEVMSGAPVTDIAVIADEEAAPVIVITARASGIGEISVRLPVDDAEEFLIAGLAAVAAARKVAN